MYEFAIGMSYLCGSHRVNGFCAVTEDIELLVRSALSSALVPRIWLNWQGHCLCSQSTLYSQESAQSFILPRRRPQVGADIPPFNKMLSPLKKDTKTHLELSS